MKYTFLDNSVTQIMDIDIKEFSIILDTEENSIKICCESDMIFYVCVRPATIKCELINHLINFKLVSYDN